MGYVRANLQDTYGILDLQEKLLEIMVDIDLFCREYSIDYCLMAGSALGAERHKGFIPWDDDIDIYMTEQGYANFRTAFAKYGDKEKYYLQEWGKTEVGGKTLITMAKIRLNHSQINEATYQELKEELVEQMIEKIVDMENNDETENVNGTNSAEQQLLQMIAEKYEVIKYKKIEIIKEIQQIFKKQIEKYEEQIEKK